MKYKYVAVGTLLFLCITSVVMLFHMNFKLKYLEDIRKPLNKATDIVFMAVDLNESNCQAQREIWEYALLKEDESLENFLENEARVEELLKGLMVEVKKNTPYINLSEERINSLAVRDIELMDNMMGNLREMKNRWSSILSAAREIKIMAENGAKLHEAPNHDDYDIKRDLFEKKMADAESFFDKSGLSSSVDEFTKSQRDMRHDLLTKFNTEKAKIELTLYLIMGIFAVLCLGLAVIILFDDRR